MRIPVLSTLSGRIIVGFAALIFTFGGVSALSVRNMGLLSEEIQLMRQAYSRLAFISKDMSEKQTDLRQYLLQDLTTESAASRVRGRMARFRKARESLLTRATEVLDGLKDVAVVHRRHFHNTRLRLQRIREGVAETDALYAAMLAAPPLERSLPAEGAPSPQYLDALEGLKRLQRREGVLQGKVVDFARLQNEVFAKRSKSLESIGDQVRYYTVVLGALAVFVGLLITIWGAMTLRPLGRLRDAARQIARGDYASRIEESGPAEIADLAREFNVMGRAVEERERELVRSERLVAVGKMAAMITHEVRNPLSAIGLNTELLEEELAELPPDRAHEARLLCRSITTEVDRLTAITEEYLQFARLPQPKLQEEDLSRLVQDLARFQREQLAARGVNLVLELGPTAPMVHVDEGQLRQALLNLVRNAAEATEEAGGGDVTISVARVANSELVEVRVVDNGAGIDEALRANLFEPFFSTKQGGTGLGLALTQQIIRGHGGDVAIESEPGKGAIFAFTLPIATSARIAGPDDGIA